MLSLIPVITIMIKQRGSIMTNESTNNTARQIIPLKAWRFNFGDAKNGWYRGADDSNWEAVQVPHDWSIKRGFSTENSSGTGYVTGGIGWYRCRFNLKPQPGKKVRITFEGVYNNSMVWCNSNYLGKRPYGYSTFVYDITEFLAPDGDNVISVKVPHTETADSRWFTGSGITRPVYVTVTGTPCVADFGIFVHTEDVTSESATVIVDTELDGGDALVRHTIIAPDGTTVAEMTGTKASCKVENPLLWGTESPNLYTLVTEVISNGEVTDTVQTRFGIRDIKFDASGKFFLNGKETKLRGVCLHHDAGCLGAAVPKEVWRRRLMKLAACGCNAIRTSHNPPDPALLDLCDEMGFLVMDEAFDEWEAPKNKWWQGHNVNPPKLNGYYEDFITWGEADIKTMVRRDRNHPSIILWSIGNEVDYPNDPYVYSGFDIMTGNNDAGKSEDERRYDVNRPDARRLAVIARRLVKWVKEVDTTRPVTAALAYPEVSVKTGYMQALDVAGYNYKENLYEEHHKAFPNAIIYGSENGHDPRAWEVVRDNDYICGQFLWTGVDYLGEARGWPVRGADFGLLDLAGFEKRRYFHRCAMWIDTPTGFLMPARRFRENTPTIACYTNAKSAELFVDGVSLGRRDVEHYVCDWEVSSHEGTYTATLYFADGTTREISIPKPGTPKTLSVSVWNSERSECGAYACPDEVHQIEVHLVDENGIPVTFGDGADTDIAVSVSGGELLGIENGDIADLTSYGESHRRLFHGRLIVYVRVPEGKAEVTLTPADNRFPAVTLTLKRI